MVKNAGLPKLPRVVNFNFNKHLPQSFADKTSDLFFVLSTAYLAARKERELTKLMMEKALFKASQILVDKNLRFFNTFFFIDKYGPHNNIFYRYLEELENAELINVEGRAINLTAKGLRVITDLLEEASQDVNVQKVLLALQQKIEEYSNNKSLAVEETHSQRVVDTTDNNKVKTINELIGEVKPGQEFKKASQFKYIEFDAGKRARKIQLPSKLIYQLESTLAKIEPSDFEQSENISHLFMPG